MKALKCSRLANDPRIAYDPQIATQMIPGPEMKSITKTAKKIEWCGLRGMSLDISGRSKTLIHQLK